MLVKTDAGDLRPTPTWSVRFLLHNVVVHPIAGVFWFLGLGRLGNRIHELGKPK